MADQVLLINNSMALLTDALVANLKNEDISIIPVAPEVDQIGVAKDKSDVFMLFAGDFVYAKPDLLVYLKDLCFGEEKLLCVVGYSKEIAEIEDVIPKILIEREFERPVDVKILSKAVHELVREKAKKLKKRHILLVDDDVVFLQMMQKWLSSRYRVTVVKSGMQAITFIGAHTPDLILLDYDMPITPGPQIPQTFASFRARYLAPTPGIAPVRYALSRLALMRASGAPVSLSFSMTVRIERGSPLSLGLLMLEPYHFTPQVLNRPPR